MFSIIKSIFGEGFTVKFLFFVVIGLSLSVTVVFSAAGIMTGFSSNLRTLLKQDKGDFYITNSKGFFKNDLNVKDLPHTEILQLEGFLIDQDAKGVIIRGINDDFSKFTDLKLNTTENCLTIGNSLANILGLVNGDEVTLSLVASRDSSLTMPKFFRFKICQITSLGLFLSDSRYVYANLNYLQKITELDGLINMIAVNGEPYDIDLPQDYMIDRMSNDYAFIFHAVEAEKKLLSMILQIIVVVAIFNVMAFIIFLKERYAKEIFYLQAIGLSKKRLIYIWSAIIFFIVVLSNSMALFMMKGVNYILKQSFFELPAKIYHFSTLQVILTPLDYLIISGLSLIWPFLSSIHIFRSIYKQSIISNVKREFGQ